MKERLTGAIVLVALIVLLVPELLTGPVRPAKPSAASGNSAEEPPLRSYTINLSDEAHSQTSGSGPTMPQPGNPDQPASAPPPASGAPSTATIPAPPSSQSSQPAASQGSQSAAVAPAPVTHPQSSPAPTQKALPRLAKTHANPSSAPSHASAPGTGWMVQLGVFASHENAEHLAQEMRAKGFKASVSDVTSSSRRLYRVRVGPAADHAAAQELQGRLRAAGRSGTLVPLS